LSQVFFDPRAWDEVRGMSSAAQMCWAYLLTNRHGQLVPGLIPEALEMISIKRGIPAEEADEGLRDLANAGLLQYDARAQLIRLPTSLRYMTKPGRNHVLGWYRHWTTMPESKLKYDHLDSMREVVVKQGPKSPAAEAWAETFAAEANYPQLRHSEQLSLLNREVGIPSQRDGGTPSDPTYTKTYTKTKTSASDSGSPDPDPEQPEQVQEHQSEPPPPLKPSKAQQREMAWQQVSGAFQDAYVERLEQLGSYTGAEKPTWNGAVRKLLEPFITLHGPETVCRRIDALFHGGPWWFAPAGSVPDVKALVAHFDTLVVAARAPPPPRRRGERLAGDDLIAMGEAMDKLERERGGR
jgi:hypothetical protein